MIDTKVQNGPNRWQRNQQRGEFVKYFLSSESEEESDEEEDEKSAPSTRSVQTAAKGGAKPVKNPAPCRNARKI